MQSLPQAGDGDTLAASDIEGCVLFVKRACAPACGKLIVRSAGEVNG